MQMLLTATRSLLTMSHPIHAILHARSKRDPRLLFRFESKMGWSARSTLPATGDALSGTRIGKAVDVHAEIMRNDLLGGVLVGQSRL